MSLAENIARTLGNGKESKNRDGWLTCCPIHGDKGPSMSIWDRNGTVTVDCKTGCGYKEIKDELVRMGLLPAWVPAKKDKDKSVQDIPHDLYTSAQEKESYIWKQASKEDREYAKKYFTGRAITIDLPLCIRWNSYTDKKTGETNNMVVASASTPEDTKVYAVQRLFIDLKENKKIGAKMHGPCDGRGVWFNREGDVTELLVGEGIETVLSGIQATGKNGVAALSTSGMNGLIFPEETNTIYILVDSDPARDKASMPGQKAAHDLAVRFEATRPGRVACLVSPDDTCFTTFPNKLDFNDLLKSDPTGESIRERFNLAVKLADLQWASAEDKEVVMEVAVWSEDDLAGLMERVKGDCGAPFEPEAVAMLARLKRSDKSRFMQIREEIKQVNRAVVITELDKDIRLSPINSIFKSSRSSSSSLSSGYPSSWSSLNEKASHFQGVLITEDENGKKRLVIESEAAVIISGALQGQFAFDDSGGSWLRYTGSQWKACQQTEVDSAVTELLYAGTEGLGFRNAYETGVVALLQKGGQNRLAVNSDGMIPFMNGLLDLATMKLRPITPDSATTWVLPYDYTEEALCPNFLRWLSVAVDHDSETMRLLQAWLNALLTGRPDLQVFLHLIGPGGTGKSTFGRIVFILVGNNNATTTSLRQLETNRFEAANIYGKRLVAIEEADKYGGTVSVLKSMTGQDPLRLERKNQQQQGSFIYKGQTLMMSNERLATTDYTSGIERRRITVEFSHRITLEDRADFEKQGGEVVILHQEAPGIINWALELSRDEVTAIFKERPARVRKANLEAARFNNPIVDWMLHNLKPDPKAKTKVGTKEEYRGASGELFFRNDDQWLYPNYLAWCQGSGREKVSLQRFSSALTEAAATYKVQVEKVRQSDGTKVNGLRLRNENEESWLQVFENEGDNFEMKNAMKDNTLIMKDMIPVRDVSTSSFKEKGEYQLHASISPYFEVEI